MELVGTVRKKNSFPLSWSGTALSGSIRGTHEKHLSVLDHKKQEREKEVVQLEGQILEKKEGFQNIV